MLHAVIMAGGSGTRFWPASRRETPKQLLNMVGNRTMIQSTVDRLAGLVPFERQMVVTNRTLVDAIAAQLPELQHANIVGEPCKRDTAPCVGLAAALLVAQDPEAVMLTLPADHVIGTNEQFQAAVREGLKWIEKDPRQFVTFGIRPTYAAQSFGYIERGKALSDNHVFEIVRFREKPDAVTAQSYVDAGTFYWNSGIFLWRAETILSTIETYEPAMGEHLRTIQASVGTADFEHVLNTQFAAIQGKSIDYAVMEKYPHTITIEAPFSWDDLGSWQALTRLVPLNSDGNTLQGNHVGIDTKGCIVRTEGDQTIVTIDVEDLVIVQAGNATLVAPKRSEERIRDAVKRLEQLGLDGLL